MCLGVPGRVLEWTVRDELFGRAIIEFAGVRRECQMACVPDAVPGEYVIVHAGLALCRINASEAERTIRELQSLTAAGCVEVPFEVGPEPSDALRG
ncbi:MAG: Hydrogenase isoenzyme formation protein HypC [Planctomycetota bacterium]|jgi:hydrogenase expression/formation protein HypC